MKCRFCDRPAPDVFLDLGSAPPSNAFLSAADLDRPEVHFPLRLHTCAACKLVQVDEVQGHASLFSADYVYFSSYSSTWLQHAEAYVALAAERLRLSAASLVVEIASNDGYLLRYVQARGIPCVGIEPTASTAAAARLVGIESIERFFGKAFASEFVLARGPANLVIANNVLAHVPDLNDFVSGVQVLLAPGGVATFEFPHLMRLVAGGQFDTVYHEHFSYFSFGTVRRVFGAHGLRVWDVQELSTHGGSLRVWACHDDDARAPTAAVAAMEACEHSLGMDDMDYYRGFQSRADAVKDSLLRFLLDAKRDGKLVAGYGAAAKGNTLLNYAGVRPDLLGFVVDASPHKQGRFLPGSRIPVVGEARLRESKPDYIVILPWNLRAEIVAQLDYAREWSARFVTAVPRLEVD